MLAVLLALGSSLTWGVSDFLGGLKSRSVPMLVVLLVSQGSALLLLVAAVVVLGIEPPGDALVPAAAALGGVGEAIGVAALYRGLSVGSMSIVAPLAATAPVVPVAIGAIRGELPGAWQWAGIAGALAGMALVARSPDTGRKGSVRRSTSVGLGLLAAVGFGSSFVGTDVAAESSVPWALLVARITTVVIFLSAAGLTRPRLAVSAHEIPHLMLIGTLVLTADAFYALATTQGLLGVVAVLSSLFPVVTVLLARAILRERMGRSQLTGAALCLVGTVAVSAG